MNFKLLKELHDASGISGNENEVCEIVKKYYKKHNLEINFDKLGSIYGIKKSNKKNAKTLLIDAHMDEVGFLVNGFTKNGLIIIEPKGNILNYNILAQRVKILASNKKIYYGIAIIDNTNKIMTNKLPASDEIRIDIGAKSDVELKNKGISIGDQILFDSELKKSDNIIISKAVDDRLGIYLLLNLVKFTSTMDLDFNIIFSASVQEEVGLRGAKTIGYASNADLAMTIDISPSKEFTNYSGEGEIGAGTILRHFDRMTLYPRNLVKFISDVSEKNKIKIQDYYSFGGTNAGAIHLTKEGIPTLPIGILARHLHTSSTIFDINDYENTFLLCTKIIETLSSKIISKLVSK